MIDIRWMKKEKLNLKDFTKKTGYIYSKVQKHFNPNFLERCFRDVYMVQNEISSFKFVIFSTNFSFN